MIRILVTGSRTWDDLDAVWEALDVAAAGHREVVVVHGACPRGADRHAAIYCEEMAEHYDNQGAVLSEEQHPADWKGHGKHAGFIRNAEMVAAGADVCLAFIRAGSAGASHCSGLARSAGIPVRTWTS